MNERFPDLNLPDYSNRLRVREKGSDYEIYDPVRQSWVALTPEEWVRQNMTLYLSERLEIPLSRFAIEAKIEYNGLSKRCDTIIYDEKLQPMVIAEYKQPRIELSQSVFDQIAVYNMKLNVPFLVVSNGLTHIMCKADNENRRYIFTDALNYQANQLKDNGKDK